LLPLDSHSSELGLLSPAPLTPPSVSSLVRELQERSSDCMTSVAMPEARDLSHELALARTSGFEELDQDCEMEAALQPSGSMRDQAVHFYAERVRAAASTKVTTQIPVENADVRDASVVILSPVRAGTRIARDLELEGGARAHVLSPVRRGTRATQARQEQWRQWQQRVRDANASSANGNDALGSVSRRCMPAQ